MAYLSGFDPRFEGALLILDCDGQRKLLVGNECMGYLPDPELRYEGVLFRTSACLDRIGLYLTQ